MIKTLQVKFFDVHFLVLLIGMGGVLANEFERQNSNYQSEKLKLYSLEELMAVEVRAPTKMDLTLMESPAIGGVLTKREIQAFGWQNLAEVLMRQPGFSPSQDYERVTPSARGQHENWNNNHLLLLVNGMPVNSSANGTAYIWDMLPLSMVESIEILRGPGSALYGSNATNGVLAINTHKPEQGEIEGTIGYDQTGTQIYSLSGGKSYSMVQVLGGYQFHSTDGNSYLSHDASRRVDQDGKYIRLPVKDERATQSAFLFADGRGALEGLSLQLQLAYWNFETGHGWLYRISDEPERAFNSQECATLAYRPPALWNQKLQLEFAASFQNTHRDYRLKLLPDSLTFLGTPMPNGVTEALDSKSQDLFTRAQAEYRMIHDVSVLIGLENMLYFSHPNKLHQANIDVNRGGTLLPFADGEMHDMRSTSEGLDGHPIENLGIFLQGSTGRILRSKMSATAGIRYDLLDAKYLDLDQTDKPLKEKFLEQFSPRLGLVFFPVQNWTLKALAEKAFRAPSPSEMFGANTLLGFTNPGPLQPETMTTYTLASDVLLFRHLNFRIDAFVQEYENQIAFSGSKNYTSNIYSRTTNGIESELQFDAELASDWNFSGFANHTLSHQLSETTLEPGIAKSDRLTWAPEHVANIGALVFHQGWIVSLQIHYQGTVYRRTSDYQSLDGTPTAFSAYRPRSLQPWTTLDLGLTYQFKGGLSLKVRGTNVLDEQGYLMKAGNYPFDYQIQDARFEGKIEYAFNGNPTLSGFRSMKEMGK